MHACITHTHTHTHAHAHMLALPSPLRVFIHRAHSSGAFVATQLRKRIEARLSISLSVQLLSASIRMNFPLLMATPPPQLFLHPTSFRSLPFILSGPGVGGRERSTTAGRRLRPACARLEHGEVKRGSQSQSVDSSLAGRPPRWRLHVQPR